MPPSEIPRDITDHKRMEAALERAERERRELQRRLLALAAGSSALLESPRLDDVLPGILGLARDLIAADGYAVWRFDTRRKAWQVVASSGISTAFAGAVVDVFGEQPPATLPFTEPLLVDDVMSSDLLAARRDEYRAEGIASMLALPLRVAGAMSGTLVCYYRSRRQFTDLELHVGRALANLTSAAITTAELYDEQRRSREAAERKNDQAMFLANAAAALSSSLDYAQTLATVAGLAVPHVADWCAVDVVEDDGATRRLAVAHVNQEKIEAVRLLQERYPADANRPGSLAHVVRTGQPVFVTVISDDMIAAAARDAEHLEAIKQLGLVSYACVPMVAHGRTLGVLTFATAESGRVITDDDFQFLKDVAARAALAVDNARAYEQVTKANSSKDHFLAMVSHEMRTPVNAVLGWTRLLRLGAVAADRRGHALDVIERNAQLQLRLVEDLLDMSRIVAGKFRVDMQPVDGGTMVRSAVESMRPWAADKGVSLDLTISTESVVVRADAARLEQVVCNLVGNAVKVSAPGDCVRVVLARDGALAVISVTDSGPGIAEDEVASIFEAFEQGRAARDVARGGLGLGLAIVRHIVERHGGRTTVTSAGPGQGATFRVEIPLELPATVQVGTDDDTFGLLAVSSRLRLDGLELLAVDDNAEALELLTRMLTAHGANVRGARSAAEALAALDERLPAVIISDIAMPEQDGFALIAAVRERPRSRGGAVPAIALTAFSRPEDRMRSLRSGFQIHLSKPVDLDELLSAVVTLARVQQPLFAHGDDVRAGLQD